MALQYFGSNLGFVVYVDDSLGSEMDAVGEQFLNNCTADLIWMASIFGGLTPPNLPFTINLGTTGDPGSHSSCSDTTIEINVAAGGSIDPLLGPAMGVAEMTECFEDALNNGWNCGQSMGEGLSGIMAWWRYPIPMVNDLGPRGNNWLLSTRPDWISTTENTDGNPVSSGCAELFINFLCYQLLFGPEEIVLAGGPNLAATYATLTGDFAINAIIVFYRLISTRFPAGQDWLWPDDSIFPLPFGRLIFETNPPNPPYPPLEVGANWQPQDVGENTRGGDFGPICSNPAVITEFAGSRISMLAINQTNHLIYLYQEDTGAEWDISFPADQFTVFGNPTFVAQGVDCFGYVRSIDGDLIEAMYQGGVGWSSNDVTAGFEAGNIFSGILQGFSIAGDPVAIVANGMVQVFARSQQISNGAAAYSLVQFTKPVTGVQWTFTDLSTTLNVALLYNPTLLVAGTTLYVFYCDFNYDLVEIQLPFGGSPSGAPITTGLAISGMIVGVPTAVTDGTNIYVFVRTNDDSLWMLSTPISGGAWSSVNVSALSGGNGIGGDPGALAGPVTRGAQPSLFVYARSNFGGLLEFRKDPDPSPWTAYPVDANDVTGCPVPYWIFTSLGLNIQVFVTSATLTPLP